MDEMRTFSDATIGNVRVTMMKGEPWFVGKDVTDILGYKNSRDTLAKRVDTEDKGGSKLRHPQGTAGDDRDQ